MTPVMFPPDPYIFNTEDNNRVLYLCGPHGVGKSTLIEDLKAYDPHKVNEQIAHMESIDDEVTRQVWRMGLHCVEHRENLAYVQTQSDSSVVIGDRCCFDDLVYMSAFEKLGWLSKKEYKNIVKMTKDLYKKSNTPQPKKFVILLPPLDWNIERIKERWDKGEKAKWCEMNFNYLSTVRDEFLALGKKHVDSGDAILVEETDRKQRMLRIKEWLVENDLEDFIIEGRILVESQSRWGS